MAITRQSLSLSLRRAVMHGSVPCHLPLLLILSAIDLAIWPIRPGAHGTWEWTDKRMLSGSTWATYEGSTSFSSWLMCLWPIEAVARVALGKVWADRGTRSPHQVVAVISTRVVAVRRVSPISERKGFWGIGIYMTWPSYFDILDRMAFLLSLPGNDCMDHPGNTSLASDSLADQEVLHRPSHKGLGRSSTLSSANCTSLNSDLSFCQAMFWIVSNTWERKHLILLGQGGGTLCPPLSHICVFRTCGWCWRKCNYDALY